MLGNDLGKFPAPLLMNTVHFAMQAMLSKSITWYWSNRFQPNVAMSWTDYFTRGKLIPFDPCLYFVFIISIWYRNFNKLFYCFLLAKLVFTSLPYVSILIGLEICTNVQLFVELDFQFMAFGLIRSSFISIPCENVVLLLLQLLQLGLFIYINFLINLSID